MKRSTALRLTVLALGAAALSGGCRGILGIEDWTPRAMDADGGPTGGASNAGAGGAAGSVAAGGGSATGGRASAGGTAGSGGAVVGGAGATGAGGTAAGGTGSGGTGIRDAGIRDAGPDVAVTGTACAELVAGCVIADAQSQHNNAAIGTCLSDGRAGNETKCAATLSTCRSLCGAELCSLYTRCTGIAACRNPAGSADCFSRAPECALPCFIGTQGDSGTFWKCKSGDTNCEGRCMTDPGTFTKPLQKDNCLYSLMCVPCYDPVTLASTGVCNAAPGDHPTLPACVPK